MDLKDILGLKHDGLNTLIKKMEDQYADMIVQKNQINGYLIALSDIRLFIEQTKQGISASVKAEGIRKEKRDERVSESRKNKASKKKKRSS